MLPILPVGPASAPLSSPPAPGMPGPPAPNDRLGALLQLVETRHSGAHQQMVQALAGVAGARPSAASMLRLQAAIGEFGVRVQLSVRLAEDLSRAVQTLTQRT